MADAMVTARMPRGKKEAGNKVLASLGVSASQAINELYDYLLEHKALPYREEKKEHERIPQEKIEEARAYVRSIPRLDIDNELLNMDKHELKRHKLISKGLATEEDFT